MGPSAPLAPRDMGALMDRRSFLKRASVGVTLSVPALASAAYAWEPTETPELIAATESFQEASKRHKPALAAIRVLHQLAAAHEKAMATAKIDSGAADAIEALYWAADE